MSCYSEGVPRVYLAISMLAATVCFGEPAPLLHVLQGELERNFSVLKEKADPAPYFLQYSVIEQQTQDSTGTFGALRNESKNHNRILDVNVRVGSPKLDNYHSIGRERPRFFEPRPAPRRRPAR